MAEQLFIELLQVAVGRRACLSRAPSEEEWEELFALAVKHAMLGVCYYAIQRINVQEQVPDQELLYKWYHVTESIRYTNEVLNKRCRKVQKKFREAGIRSSILKGQGIGKYYGKELSQYRQSGDIDIYVDCGLEGALKFAHDSGIKIPHWDFKHLHLDVFRDTEVEVHYHVEVLINLYKNRKLQRWFKANEELLFSQHEDLVIPTLAFNRFYILLHIYRHFLYEGVGMRQLLDYFFVLQKDYSDAEKNENSIDIVGVLNYFGMMRFTRGIMWVMQEVFALDKQYMYCEPLESEGRFILNEVMMGGNFGNYDERISFKTKGTLFSALAKCKHSLYLVWHYPSEVFWPPVWMIWHRFWKLQKKMKLAMRKQ